MTLTAVLIVAAALIGIGVYGALSQQSFGNSPRPPRREPSYPVR